MENKIAVEQNKQIVIKFNNEFFVNGNAEITKEVLADAFVNHAAPPNAPTNAGPMIQFNIGFHKAFSDMSMQIREIFGDGDRVCTRVSITATHTGEFMGKAATGKKVVLNLISIDILKDGKITNHWSQNDFMQVLQGL